MLLTSDVKVSPNQLPATSSQAAAQRDSSERPSQPADNSGGFLLSNAAFGLKTDLDSSESGGVGGADDDSASSDTPTLYGFLFDLFGESLSLRLSHYNTFRTSSTLSEASTPHSGPSSRDVRQTNKAVAQFLSREGFKPIRVDLPYYLPPHRSEHQHSSSSFSVPRFLLPVQGNALERGMRIGLEQRMGMGHQSLRKGASSSYRRRTHKLRHTFDIGSLWI